MKDRLMIGVTRVIESPYHDDIGEADMAVKYSEEAELMDPATDYDTDDFDTTCQRCDGEGEILVCWDDMCQGQGYCIHGDGYATCPNCKGSGEYR